MPVLFVAQPFMGIGIVLAHSLRGAGRTREALVVSVVGAVVVRLSATWFFAVSLGLGLTGVWMGSTLDWIVRSCLLGIIGARTAAREAAHRAVGGLDGTLEP
jgi:Na+-driven multidrug efflux pump